MKEPEKKVEEIRLIGTGNTATVYEWKDGKVLKLFVKDYSKEAVETEFQNAIAIDAMNFKKSKAYKIECLEGRYGIVYDKYEGESLLDWLMKNGDLYRGAVIMAGLHKEILNNKVEHAKNYKEILRSQLNKSVGPKDEKWEAAMTLLDKLPDGDTLCHGDFHPGNIIVTEKEAVVIDFMNVCRGYFMYDIARTVFLIEYTSAEDAEKEEFSELSFFKKTLTDRYLEEMNVKREMLTDYLTVIAEARKGEL